MRNKAGRFFRWAWRLAISLILPGNGLAQTSPIKYVNPFIGTSVSDFATTWGNEGGCYPGAVAVSGYIQLSPETRHAAISGYDFRDSSIFVFSCLHHSSGYPGGSAGSVYIMPVNQTEPFKPLVTSRPFSHKTEEASPGYYRVRLTDDGTDVEATASTRAGMFRIRFPKGVVPKIFIGDAGTLTVTGDSLLSGGRYNLSAVFDRAFVKTEKTGDGLILSFSAETNDITEIIMRISASPLSVESAGANREEESPRGISFDSLKRRTALAWQKELGVATINDAESASASIFYTALYHSLLIPWIVSDVKGNYRGADGSVHHTSGANEYGKFSPWDTYRTLNPLRALLYPEIEKDVALSMFDVYLQTGRLPVESMTGNHAIVILADDYMKGLLPVDRNKLFRALQSNVTDSPFVQSDMPAYIKEGYLSTSWPESVTRTVEYGYNDWVLAQYARSVMHDEAAGKKYTQRAQAYRKLFDPESQLLLPREHDRFLSHAGTTGYKEGDAWAYSFSVPQDTKGLSNLMGGDTAFVHRLDSALKSGAICFDNETVFHVPWLFTEAGDPALTQSWIYKLRNSRFAATPGGLPGNDDLGSTSGWYVWSALGFYPLTPGRPLYTITSPLFHDISLNLANGKTLRIIREGPGPFISDLSRNNHRYNPFSVTHSELSEGGEWHFKTNSIDIGAPGRRINAAREATGDIYPFSETKTGTDIRISAPRISAMTVRPDERFSVRYTALNRGAAGSRRLTVTDGNRILGATNIYLDSGAKTQGEIFCRAYLPGKRTLLFGKERLSITVILPRKAILPGYRIENVQAKSLLSAGEKQDFTFDIQNVDGRTRRFVIPVSIDALFRDSLLVTLRAGETRHLRDSVTMGGVTAERRTTDGVTTDGVTTDGVTTTQSGEKQLQIGNASFPFRVYRTPRESLLMDLKWTGGAEMVKDSGIMQDRSGFKNDGRVVAVSAMTTIGVQDGVPVGGSDYLAVKSAPGLDQMDSNLTMMAWIYPEKNAPGLADIFSKGDHHVLQLVGKDQLTFFAGGWGRGDCTVALPANWTGHWHHVAGVCQGRKLILYLDGVEAGLTLTDAPVNLSNENHWNLGRNEEFPGIRMFNGVLNYVRVYAAALPPGEIRAEMQRERPQQ